MAQRQPLSVGPEAGSFLARLDPGASRSLLDLGRRRRFPAGSVLFSEGDSSDRVVVLLGGRVKVSSFTEDGREVVLALSGPGDLLGDLSTIDRQPRSATAIAIEAAEGLVLGAEDFREWLERNPKVALILLESVARRLREADRKRVEFGTHDSTGRVARRLVELADRFGEREGDAIVISVPLSQQELAGFTGCSREAVSKALHSLRSRGLIETRRRHVVVLDAGGLRRRAS